MQPPKTTADSTLITGDSTLYRASMITIAEAWELPESRRISDEESPSAETRWVVRGAADEVDALNTLKSVVPTSFSFPDSRVAYLAGIELEEAPPEFHLAACKYEPYQPPSFDDVEYEFQVSARTERIYQSLQTTPYAPAGKQAPNLGGAIGFDGETVQGVDPLTAYSTFQLTKHWKVADIDQAYQLTLEGLVGAVNNAIFYGRAAGTVKFLGASGRINGDKFPIAYQFGFRPNISNLTIDQITVTSANGWDVIDVLYEFQADTTAKKRVQRPRAVYVHRIDPLASFSGLGL